MLTDEQISGFRETVWSYFREHRRSMPWRDNPTPYNVLVSELMLQHAFNCPAYFIETNVRSVYFYHFFPGADAVDDKALFPLLEQTLDREHTRQWYWALMDYGSHLKQTHGNNISRSKHYTRQSAFEGSRRQLRGEVIRRLLPGPLSCEQLAGDIRDERLESVIVDLTREGFVLKCGTQLRLTGELELP